MKVPGRGWAYVGAVLGGVVSIAANVAHSYVPPQSAPADWAPQGGAVLGAVFWPVALFVAIEILARVVWPDGRRWVALRWLGLVPVAVVAAVVSYLHLSGLLAFYGEDTLTVVFGPLAVDGLMVMATGALIATGRQRVTEPATEPVPVPAADVPAVPAAASTPTRTRTAPTKTARTGTASKTGTAKKPGTRTDAELLEALAAVPRDDDGTVPVRRAASALGTGPDRARKLLAAEGLLRTEPDAEPAPKPVNGHPVPALVDVR